jgi:hypothetical protein
VVHEYLGAARAQVCRIGPGRLAPHPARRCAGLSSLLCAGVDMTVDELLRSAPDDQVVRLKICWRVVAAGDWAEAAHSLRNAAREGDTDWHPELRQRG